MDKLAAPQPVTAPPEDHPGSLDRVRSLLKDGAGLVHDHVKLATLEGKKAGLSLVVILILGVVLAVLLISSWLALLGAAMLFLVEQGYLRGSSAMLLGLVINLLMILFLLWMVYRQINSLKFPATVRSLKKILSEPSPMENAR